MERQPDPGDRRSIHVVLTSKGRETVRRVLPLHADAARECLQPLETDQLRSLEVLLRCLPLGFEGGPSEKNWVRGER